MTPEKDVVSVCGMVLVGGTCISEVIAVSLSHGSLRLVMTDASAVDSHH